VQELFGLPSFRYSFSAGPVETAADLCDRIQEGNCRLALQCYFFWRRGLFFSPEQILCPGLYTSTGEWLCLQRDSTCLRPGDVVIAERLRNTQGQLRYRDQHSFPSQEAWTISLHCAVVEYRDGRPHIWHASPINSGTGFLDMQNFLYYYRLVGVKRL
jgi:hypothetical protein